MGTGSLKSSFVLKDYTIAGGLFGLPTFIVLLPKTDNQPTNHSVLSLVLCSHCIDFKAILCQTFQERNNMFITL